MSLQAQLDTLTRTEGTRLQNSKRNVLTLDIERFPGAFTARQRGTTVTGEFWGLSDQKRGILGRRLHPDEVTRWPRTICVAWKFYDSKRVEFAAEWEPMGARGMFRAIWDAVDRADIVVGHNVRGFDLKHLTSGWMELGWPDPSTFKVMDTLTLARAKLGDESMTLDALCKRYGVVAKSGKYDVETARAALAGDKAKQRELKAYNVGDIHATEGWYDRLRGRMPNHPHLMTGPGGLVCNQCQSTDLVPNGRTLASINIYDELRCNGCGASVKPRTTVGRVAETRGAS